MTRVWVVRGGKEGRFEQTAVETNKMALGWEKVEDLGGFKDKAAVLERLKEAYPGSPDGRLRRWTGQLYKFATDIVAGDLIVMPGKEKEGIFIGMVDGEYSFNPNPDSEFRHLRSVNWKKEPVPRDVFGQDLLGSFNASGTLFEVKKNDAVNRVRAVLENGSDPGAGGGDRFDWVPFYEAVADTLRGFKDGRKKLLDGIFAVKSRMDVENIPFTPLEDRFQGGTERPLRDICPFTVIGSFNRGITDVNRGIIAGALREFLGIKEPVPELWGGIPVLNNMKSWFFGFDKDRGPEDINKLWETFSQALEFSESDDEENRVAFIKAYDDALQVDNTAWNLTMGLYWIRPENFPTLDEKSRKYIAGKLDIAVPQNVPDAAGYLEIIDALKARFKEKDFPIHSFPELSLAAWENKPLPPPPKLGPQPPEPKPEPPRYSIDDIMEEGCFLEPSSIEEMLERLRSKKNIVLQGPPGTGKTWLAKKLAFVLVGRREEANIRAVQFHPGLSYEDFVRGWRPSGDGKLELVDGPFLEIAETARQSPGETYVIVIEEINRGNPAQILGELLTLLEADKRTRESALALSYPRPGGERVFIPENLYVIGTMNIADRSLALVDFALRRRFAFIDLEPALNDRWREWCHQECGIGYGVLDRIRDRIEALNERISGDPSLGSQFRIGHSYVTPNSTVEDPDEWFRQVASTEIGPLLEEYWFDSPETAREARRNLLEGQ